jgi:hypothetical protein
MQETPNPKVAVAIRVSPRFPLQLFNDTGFPQKEAGFIMPGHFNEKCPALM